jgi:hypothetical protein
MDYATFLRGQWQTLLNQWLGIHPPGGVNVAYIALPDIEALERLRQPHMPGGACTWGPLANLSPTEALVRRDAAGQPELWVRPEEKDSGSGRYAEYWARFASLFGFANPPSAVAGRDLAVDHLFPETAAARRGWLLVRAMPVDRRSNSLVGSTTEKVEAGRGGRNRPRTATSITLAKVTGFQGSFSKRNATGDVARALLAHIRTCGLTVPAGTMLPDNEEAGLMAWVIGTYRR